MKNSYFLLLLLISSWLFYLPVKAQIQFQEVNGTPFENVWRSSVAFSDIDNDNDSDLLISGYNSVGQLVSKLYFNDGIGNFTEAQGTSITGVWYSSVAFSDIDGDNDQDLIITGQADLSSGLRASKLYTNDGAGNFSEVNGTPFDAVSHSSISFADVDGDNDQDLLITGNNNSAQPISKLYVNDGSGVFSLVNGTAFVGVYDSSVAFADIDNDNDQDLLITGKTSASQPFSKFYSNNGSGHFTEVNGATIVGVYQGSVAFADIDNDNDQDLIITGVNSSLQQTTKLYINDGLGSFAEVNGVPFDNFYLNSLAFADLDNDNDMDLFIAGRGGSAQATAKLYLNNGVGSFIEDSGTTFEGLEFSSVAFSDINGDNLIDILYSGMTSSGIPTTKLYVNTTTLGSEDNSISNDIILFPNPTRDGIFHIKVSGLFNSESHLSIFNMFGQQVISKSVTLESGKFQVDASGLNRGIYVIKLKQNNRYFTSKLIIK